MDRKPPLSVPVLKKKEAVKEVEEKVHDGNEKKKSNDDELSGSSSSGSEDSDYDSEEERQKREERRKRREQMIAEKAAAAAVKAIKDREDAVARLEGEKESLVKILEEREKQQAQEVNVLPPVITLCQW